ncbi:Unknown protein [Striga hermonthica]|uniref:Uncharacterized protein n=1 Tax=Striga hermonthica TaxID=68872 RepID=A0A9N7MEG4_STRHE|nr:Unknown protein [Striga hermonthica]
METGFEVAEDLDFYRGRVHVWSSAVRPGPNVFSARIQKTIKQVHNRASCPYRQMTRDHVRGSATSRVLLPRSPFAANSRVLPLRALRPASPSATSRVPLPTPFAATS